MAFSRERKKTYKNTNYLFIFMLFPVHDVQYIDIYAIVSSYSHGELKF